jgi:hypothetical protein
LVIDFSRGRDSPELCLARESIAEGLDLVIIEIELLQLVERTKVSLVENGDEVLSEAEACQVLCESRKAEMRA